MAALAFLAQVVGILALAAFAVLILAMMYLVIYMVWDITRG